VFLSLIDFTSLFALIAGRQPRRISESPYLSGALTQRTRTQNHVRAHRISVQLTLDLGKTEPAFAKFVQAGRHRG
jgi:hypothetical protein